MLATFRDVVNIVFKQRSNELQKVQDSINKYNGLMNRATKLDEILTEVYKRSEKEKPNKENAFTIQAKIFHNNMMNQYPIIKTKYIDEALAAFMSGQYKALSKDIRLGYINRLKSDVERESNPVLLGQMYITLACLLIVEIKMEDVEQANGYIDELEKMYNNVVNAIPLTIPNNQEQYKNAVCAQWGALYYDYFLRARKGRTKQEVCKSLYDKAYFYFDKCKDNTEEIKRHLKHSVKNGNLYHIECQLIDLRDNKEKTSNAIRLDLLLKEITANQEINIPITRYYRTAIVTSILSLSSKEFLDISECKERLAAYKNYFSIDVLAFMSKYEMQYKQHLEGVKRTEENKENERRKMLTDQLQNVVRRYIDSSSYLNAISFEYRKIDKSKYSDLLRDYVYQNALIKLKESNWTAYGEPINDRSVQGLEEYVEQFVELHKDKFEDWKQQDLIRHALSAYETAIQRLISMDFGRNNSIWNKFKNNNYVHILFDQYSNDEAILGEVQKRAVKMKSIDDFTEKDYLKYYKKIEKLVLKEFEANGGQVRHDRYIVPFFSLFFVCLLCILIPLLIKSDMKEIWETKILSSDIGSNIIGIVQLTAGFVIAGVGSVRIIANKHNVDPGIRFFLTHSVVHWVLTLFWSTLTCYFIGSYSSLLFVLFLSIFMYIAYMVGAIPSSIMQKRRGDNE